MSGKNGRSRRGLGRAVPVFLDLDGTLVDSIQVLREAYTGFVTARGGRPSRAEFDRLNGPTTAQVADALRKAHRLGGGAAKVREDYIAHVADVYLRRARPAKGAVRTLERLRRSGHPLHLVTSSLPRIAGAWIRKSGWRRYFRTMTFGDEVRAGKPDPAIYRTAFKKAGLSEGAERIVVEDSPNGCAAAKRAGACVLAVGPSAAQTRPYSDGVFKDLDGVSRWLLSGGWSDARYVDRAGAVRAGFAGSRPRVTRDRLLCLTRKTADGRYLGRFRPYWDFVAAMRRRAPHDPALAVCAVTTHGSGADMKVLMGQRSREVAMYPGEWETVPAGGIDPDAARKGGTIDLRGMILKEFGEETGLDPALAARVTGFGAVRDRSCNAYDLALHLELRRGSDRARLDFPKKEYTRMRWVSRQDIPKFVKARQVVPTLGPLLRAFELYERKENNR
jgi:HAD superfamily hydrolase (TIGR01509 family)